MSDVPNILMVFSNPAQDLNGIKKERTAIAALLRRGKLQKKNFDFDFREDESLMDVINGTVALKGYTASFFHFSGHANEESLLFPGGKASIKAMCSVLNDIKTKIAFLNGCCTKGFIEELFENTGVIAVIATYTKIGDMKAAKLSNDFYHSFLGEENTLYEAFQNIRNGHEQFVLHQEGFDMSKQRDIKITRVFPDETSKNFQWGLFYKNTSYRNIKIGSLLGSGTTGVNLIAQQIDETTKLLNKARQSLETIEQNLAKGGFDDLYEQQKKIVKQLENQLNESLQERLNMQTAQKEKEENAKKIKLSLDFDRAIKNINYIDQREVYANEVDNQFACYAAIADKDALIDLLLLRMKEEFGLDGDSHLTITVRFKSGIAMQIWSALAHELGLTNDPSPENIAGLLVNDFFLGNSQTTSHQHIFLKININLLSIEEITEFVCEFWTNVQKAYVSTIGAAGSQGVWHKMIVILIDDTASPERLAQIEAITAAVNMKLATRFTPMPWVEPLQKQQIADWIRINSLDRVGITKTMAEEIYKESDSGKIRKVLESVHRRCKMKDLQLFYDLNISRDDSQTLFG